MKIVSIHLYSFDGRRRDLSFQLNGLNVITGRASTGKSAIADIVAYCMGRDSYTVPVGAIRDKVSWYAVRFQFDSEQVLIARPAPAQGRATSTIAMMRRGSQISIPDFGELVANADIDAVVDLLSRLLGIPENETVVPLDQSRTSFKANIKHTFYYLFQRQTIIANKDQLFYRQNEPMHPQTIKDTIPILLRVYSDETYSLQDERRRTDRDRRLLAKRLDLTLSALTTSEETAFQLVAEAQAAGLIGEVDRDTELGEILDLLQTATSWSPANAIGDADEQISTLQDELSGLSGPSGNWVVA